MEKKSELAFSDFTVSRNPPPNRVDKHTRNFEEHLPEASVMLAFALHLVAQGAKVINIQPDGEHGKRFAIREWFESRGYDFEHSGGRVLYAGAYARNDHEIVVKLRAGVGDVVAICAGTTIVAECKGGILNTRHPGQQSRLRKGLCEAIGLLLTRQRENERHVAVVPDHPATERLARKMIARVHDAGIEIALVDRNGSVRYVD